MAYIVGNMLAFVHTLANVPLCLITCAEAKDQTRQVFFKADGFLGGLQVALVCQGPCVEICIYIQTTY